MGFLASSDPQHDAYDALPNAESSAARFPYHESSSEERSSIESASTPVPSRPASPPHLTATGKASRAPSEAEEPTSPLLGGSTPYSQKDKARKWWNIGNGTSSTGSRRRRRKRDGYALRIVRKATRRLVQHPLFPRQPVTIAFAVLLFSLFGLSLGLSLKYLLNPDKEPLPWRAYCAIPPTNTVPPAFRRASSFPYLDPIPNVVPEPFPPDDLDTLPPAGVLVGVFSMDSSFERRMLIRSTWASHPRSRNGAGQGDDGKGTSRTLVRFIMGQPRKNFERQIETEMEMYNDLIILPMVENMNNGKTHAYFTWAASNAWVPPVYFDTPVPAPDVSYANQTGSPLPLAPHDPVLAWEQHASGHPQPWVRPDYVVKVDDDAFVMLAELEARMRTELHAKGQRPYGVGSSAIPPPPYLEDKSAVHADNGSATAAATNERRGAEAGDPLVYWGYLVKNKFMGGELYGLSWSIVDWVANDPTVKGMVKGAEDKTTARWMTIHPQAPEIQWASERCWMYDHPRSGTVYAHGFLFPSERTRIRNSVWEYLRSATEAAIGGNSLTEISSALSSSAIPTPTEWAHSSVSTFGVRYVDPAKDLSLSQSVEALVEGSGLSHLRMGKLSESLLLPPDLVLVYGIAGVDASPGVENTWNGREGQVSRYEQKRVGGTVVVHFIKKNAWFLETALALLGSKDYTDAERESLVGGERLPMGVSSVWTDVSAFKNASASA
ncbi:glycosyltransferase family 31 protein [Coniophora puteana RWD-64-598 SS2]|uniref:Glycosyltransferase family 31 protein n=1 Tax=Coniophora puteana (strain RWD-64-598) TaxID=741705 RepID=A0A5M3N5R5_CONPW|nr:glycosyltransferase family 31 protein [Coniophora puteana RWD-64-598 SS2]EIW86749.1 glycosyltransferase family 31 protein [Coniophora puteana RWD-64-598 SS2]